MSALVTFDHDAILDAVEEAMRRVHMAVATMLTNAQSIRTLGSVPGRSIDEDVEIAIDRKCGKTLRDWLIKKERLNLRIVSEHGDSGVPNAPAIAYLDDFDGSGPLKKGFRASIYYSVITIFDDLGVPRIGACLDFCENKLYLASDRGVEIFDLIRCARESCQPRSVNLKEATIATYAMRSKYTLATVDRARGLFKSFQGYIHPNGGSFIPACIAVGKEGLAAYFLGEEMYSEVVPGLAFVRAAGLQACVLEADGSVKPFEFDPFIHRENGDRYRGNGENPLPRMYLFIIASSKDLLDEMVLAIKSG